MSKHDDLMVWSPEQIVGIGSAGRDDSQLIPADEPPYAARQKRGGIRSVLHTEPLPLG
jgi:hypothetical protein